MYIYICISTSQKYAKVRGDNFRITRVVNQRLLNWDDPVLVGNPRRLVGECISFSALSSPFET